MLVADAHTAGWQYGCAFTLSFVRFIGHPAVLL